LRFLAISGVIHGAREWSEMLLSLSSSRHDPLARDLRLLGLAVSLFLLVEFGLRLLALNDHRRGREIVQWVYTVVFRGE
jgi:hypothetical protein